MGANHGLRCLRCTRGVVCCVVASSNDDRYVFRRGWRLGLRKCSMRQILVSEKCHWIYLSKGLFYANRYLGQYGIYDLQRPTKNTFVEHYADAANYAVGVYMNGAGYSLAETIMWSKLNGKCKSSDSADNNWGDLWTKGWSDANSGGLCSCVQ